MSKRNSSIISIGKVLAAVFVVIMMYLFFSASTVQAAISGDYEYTVSGGKVTITKYHGTQDELVMPSELGGYPVTEVDTGHNSLADSLFDNESTIRKVEIPDSVTVLGKGTFLQCYNLEEVRLSANLTTIESFNFYECKKLKQIIIPDGVTAIKDMAFFTCTELKSVKLPQNLKSIGYIAFATCPKLEEIILPDNLNTIGESAFGGCSSLTRLTIGKGVYSIGRGAFEACINLKSIIFQNKLLGIDATAFQYCSNLKDIWLVLLADYAQQRFDNRFFQNCPNLENIYVPVGSTGNFQNLSGYSGYNIIERAHKDGYIYEISGNNATIVYYNEDNENVALPNTLDGYKVTTIGDDSTGASIFQNPHIVNEITIPNNVTKLSADAFKNCTNLEKATFRQATPPSIHTTTFQDCSSLSDIHVPSGARAAYQSVPQLSAYNIIAPPIYQTRTFMYVYDTHTISKTAPYISDTFVPTTGYITLGAAFSSTKATTLNWYVEEKVNGAWVIRYKELNVVNLATIGKSGISVTPNSTCRIRAELVSVSGSGLSSQGTLYCEVSEIITLNI